MNKSLILTAGLLFAPWLHAAQLRPEVPDPESVQAYGQFWRSFDDYENHRRTNEQTQIALFWRASVRSALAPLHRIAEETTAAILCVYHLNKSSGSDPMMRLGGSIFPRCAMKLIRGLRLWRCPRFSIHRKRNANRSQMIG